MTYLFWAFAIVWIALFLYLYGLSRRSLRLEREVGELAARLGADAGAHHPAGAHVTPPPVGTPR